MEDKPPLIADGGEITIMRRTANYVYGSWRVSLPEGEEPLADHSDRADGYIYQPPNAPTGRFDLAFVRMDASIDIEHIGPGGHTSGSSDVETQMDAGQQRSQGRALIERDITERGLGRLTPGVDFSTGDIWPVKIWGQIIDLPITSLDWTTGPAGRAGWSVRVGGQLISDEQRLRSLNNEVLEQIAAERRKAQEARDKLQGEQIKQAQATADAASLAAHAALEAQEATARALDTEKQATTHHLEAIAALQQSQADTAWKIALDGDGEWSFDPHRQQATALGDWTGSVYTVGTTKRTVPVAHGDGEVTVSEPVFGVDTVPTRSGSRQYSPAQLVIYRKTPGVQKTVSHDSGVITPNAGVWQPIPVLRFKAVAHASYYVFARAEWQHTNRGSHYGLRICVNGVEATSTGLDNRIGPLGPLGSGLRRQTLELANHPLMAGDIVDVQVYSDGEQPTQREVDVTSFMSWIEDAPT